MAAFFPLPSARFVARVLYGALRDSSVELINPGHDLVTNSAPVPNQLLGPPHTLATYMVQAYIEFFLCYFY